ncbi:MAG: ribonuclease PH [Deltaproteobacteria bacterium RBG_13_65_10]|nr:MAG: ribonuclease PH [Deltaproteobacteria bacterium RBG_13_65_10]
MRPDGRSVDQLRDVEVARGFIANSRGSVLIRMGGTHVICTANVEESVPAWMRNEGRGWVTAEYGMLPGATLGRSPRESTRGRIGGRTHEIQRLIGRSLRSVTNLAALGQRTVWVDCDVIQADGGTRTASITGACLALRDALDALVREGLLERSPLGNLVGAVSVGIVDGEARLDLCYEEDSKAQVDMNFVMTGTGRFVEIQGTAESGSFTRAEMDQMTALAESGIASLIRIQREVLGRDA